MATNFTVAITATGTDGTTGETYDISKSVTLSSMTGFDKRYLSFTDLAQRNIIGIGAAVGKGTFTALNGVILINRSATRIAVIGVTSGTDTYYVQLAAGEFFVLWNNSIEANATGASWSGAFDGITNISVAGFDEVGTLSLEYLLMHA